MLLAYPELVRLVEDGVISDVSPEHINAASIDVMLGTDFLIENPNVRGQLPEIDLEQRQPLSFLKHAVRLGGQIGLNPGEFCLAATVNRFCLPNDVSAEFKLKSSMARCGLNQLTAVWADAGWNKSVLTLELSNVTRFHRLMLTSGMLIGQMVFHRHTEVPAEQSYATRGRYNGDRTVQASRRK